MSAGVLPHLGILIPAAGRGERLGLGEKALLELDGRPLLHWLVAKARRVATEVIVAVPPGCTESWAVHCAGCRLVEGGTTHLRSMEILVRASTSPLLMNVNVAMPFTSGRLMQAVAAAADLHGCAAAGLPPDVPVLRTRDAQVTEVMDRGGFALAQGPNAYRRGLLLDLCDTATQEEWRLQSFLQIAALRGHRIQIVPGEKANIKITDAEDWALAAHLTRFLR